MCADSAACAAAPSYYSEFIIMGFVSALNFIFLHDTLYNTNLYFHESVCTLLVCVPLLFCQDILRHTTFCHKKNFWKLYWVYSRRVETFTHSLSAHIYPKSLSTFSSAKQIFCVTTLLYNSILFTTTTTTTTVIHRFPHYTTQQTFLLHLHVLHIQFICVLCLHFKRWFWIKCVLYTTTLLSSYTHKLGITIKTKRRRMHMWMNENFVLVQYYLQ